jgi:hypothetical protein
VGSRPIRVVVWTLAALACASASASEAEASGLNVERVRMVPNEDGVHGGFSIGVDFQAGNTNRLDVSTSAAIAYRHRRHVVFLIGNSKYSTRTRAQLGEGISQLLEPSSRFVNKANLHLRYNFEFFSWLLGEAFTQVERDEFLLLEGRVLFGLGPRFVAFTDGRFALSLGSHWMLEYEALDPAQIVEPLPAHTLVHRSSSYLSLVYTAQRLRMSSTTYLQPRFDLARDLRLLSEANLDVTLIEPVSIRLTLRLRWDTMPSVYCARAVSIGGCAPGDQIPLRQVDLGIENAINVRF